MNTFQIFGLNFSAAKVPTVCGSKSHLWQAKWDDHNIILDNVSKNTRIELWDDLERTAKICGEERFVRDMNYLLTN